MAVALSTETRTQALASIRRFYTENFAPEIGELEVASIRGRLSERTTITIEKVAPRPGRRDRAGGVGGYGSSTTSTR